jgi:hypothetical protein
LLNRLAAAEERFLRSELLAPAVPGGTVGVRIDGIICRFRIDRAFAGWGIFRPCAADRALLVRRATMTERQRYLDLLPERRMILCHRVGREWLGWPLHHGDTRFGPPTLVPIRLPEDTDALAVAITRFDGSQCWFDRLDEGADPAVAAYLRRALADRLPVDALQRRGLTAESRTAYAAALQLIEAAEKDRTEARLERALGHAGAKLHGYREQDDCIRVEFTVDGERHVSVIGKRDLTVQLAGICLSGEDRKFDLSSLVSVLREAQGDVVRIGADDGGMPAEQYWQVHPPRR